VDNLSIRDFKLLQNIDFFIAIQGGKSLLSHIFYSEKKEEKVATTTRKRLPFCAEQILNFTSSRWHSRAAMQC